MTTVIHYAGLDLSYTHAERIKCSSRAHWYSDLRHKYRLKWYSEGAQALHMILVYFLHYIGSNEEQHQAKRRCLTF